MGEQRQEYKFKHLEIVEALIKQQGLHDGIWMLSVQFGIGGLNVQDPEEKASLSPAALVPIVSIGLARKDALNPLALDAAVVNPPPKSSKKKN